VESPTGHTKVDARELAKHIDLVGECDWLRLRRYFNDNYVGWQLGCLGVIILLFASLYFFVAFGPMAGMLILGGGLAYPFYIWQKWIQLRGTLEDTMVKADEKVIAKAISIAKWEDVGFDSAERIKGNGRPELEKFEVIRTFEPIDVERAHRSMLDAEISEALTEVARTHKWIKGWSMFFGVGAGTVAGIIELSIVKIFWPQILNHERSSSTEKLLVIPPLLVALGTYALLMHFRDKDRANLQGLDTEQLRSVKRGAKLTKQKEGEDATHV